MDFLVKLSRQTRVMVPIVVVLGLGIFGGGFLIRSNEPAANQEVATGQDANTPEQTSASPEQVENIELEEAELANPETPVDTGSLDEDDIESAAEHVELSAALDGNDVVVTLSTDKPGECTLRINNQEQSVKNDGNTCTFKNVKGPTSGKVRLEFAYISDDGSASGEFSFDAEY